MSTQNWMGNMPELGRLRIAELVLPGSHDSGMDKQNTNMVVPQEITQDVPCIEQIRGGIRALDLRLRAYYEYTPDSPYRYQLFHFSSSGRSLFADVINQLNLFYQEPANSKEIVILDFHQFDRFSGQEHTWLQQALQARLGPRMIPWSLNQLTLEELWRDHPGKTVVVAYNGPGIATFWPGVQQNWIGENTPSTQELKAFMDQVAARGWSRHRLTSIQCAKYNKVVFTPDDFSDKIDQWFESIDLSSYIQQFQIINTDWSLRSRIVENCIHASRLRALNAR
ncbi:MULTISPECIES: hypothetical protein [Pseudomonas]|jgi:hypothetical protein|uniref:Phosphatidylinositol diacylglycerol-lyase n=1 Tax=Pseudomonas sp. Hg7Tf TaxID=3236988 RepID=A0AB39HYI2_9PSED|nr:MULTISPECIES: hypothetical protein [Pseudomonas]KJK08780.1 hypothetical protein UB47_03540 [Pseudomonas sp. 5]MDD1975949.1 hypothetical protein [Pseudomonas putida]MDH2560450.1 hypothetical protein [Pseudomonas sp. Hg5Tf]QYX46264.1 hypothetical protein K3F43_16350 [Pseudomonas sp. S11A 273]